ncbi:MAG: FkbM family methyltransferase [Patescibacteria group bacterium]
MSIAIDTKPETIPAALAAIVDRAKDARHSRAILFGAGRVGRLTLDAMVGAGVPPLAIADNNAALWGTALRGVPILPPAKALERYNGATVVLAIQEPAMAAEVRQQLDDLGVARVESYRLAVRPPLDADMGQRLDEVWADEASRRECLAQLNLRLGHEDMPPYLQPAEIYFPADLFHLADNEVFADLGAYDGDTFLEFRKRVHGFTAYCGFEPDPATFQRLRRHLEHYPKDWERIHIWNMAVSEEPGYVWFRATGDVSSRIADDGESKVPCDRLDNLSWPEPPTFLKADIEGSELSALKSGERLIREHRPTLAVCVYHKPQDLWEIPLWIAGLGVGYRVYLRRYGPADTELVVYGVPEGRGR